MPICAIGEICGSVHLRVARMTLPPTPPEPRTMQNNPLFRKQTQLPSPPRRGPGERSPSVSLVSSLDEPICVLSALSGRTHLCPSVSSVDRPQRPICAHLCESVDGSPSLPPQPICAIGEICGSVHLRVRRMTLPPTPQEPRNMQNNPLFRKQTPRAPTADKLTG